VAEEELTYNTKRKEVARMKMNFLGLLISILGLAGCGGPNVRETKNASDKEQSANSGTRSKGKFDACALLTKEDVESFLAEPVGTPATTHTEAMGNTVTQCRYSAPSGNKRVGLLLRQAATTDGAAKIFRQARDTSKELSGADAQVIEGLGESAYWIGGNLKQLNVLKGDAWLIVTATLGNGTDQLTASKTVSQKILSRMP
jgi:uncharacterized membrane protein